MYFCNFFVIIFVFQICPWLEYVGLYKERVQ